MSGAMKRPPGFRSAITGVARETSSNRSMSNRFGDAGLARDGEQMEDEVGRARGGGAGDGGVAQARGGDQAARVAAGAHRLDQDPPGFLGGLALAGMDGGDRR